MKRPKNYYVEIPIAPEMVSRFKNGCAYYGMDYRRKEPRSDYWIVGVDNLIDLYWLGANLFGPVPATGLHKHVF